MADPVDVSVIIASYNTRELLEENLRSIFASPPRCSFEVIVSDDASTDGSPAMVREKFPQVVLRVNEKNSGYADTNNRAIAMSRCGTSSMPWLPAMSRCTPLC